MSTTTYPLLQTVNDPAALRRMSRAELKTLANELRAFVLADEVAMRTYRETRDFPKEEVYGLTAQMRRAAVSVPSNIVEGCARESQGEYLRYLEIAFASLRELHYQVELSRRLGYFRRPEPDDYETLLAETEKVLGALVRSLRAPNRTPPK